MNFRIKKLNETHTEQAHNLHEFVCKYLAELNTLFLNKKCRESIKDDIENHLTVGAFNSENILVGKSTLLVNLSEEKRLFEVEAPNHKGVSVLCSTCVHPEYQGLGLSKSMGDMILQEKEDNLIIVNVTIDNLNNLKNRIKQRFAIFQVVGYEKMNKNLYCLIHIDKEIETNGTKKLIHYEDMISVMSALDNGYVGLNISEEGMIQFIKDDKLREFVGCKGKSWLL